MQDRYVFGRAKPEQVHSSELKEDYIILWYVFILHTSIKGAAFACFNSYARQKAEF